MICFFFNLNFFYQTFLDTRLEVKKVNKKSKQKSKSQKNIDKSPAVSDNCVIYFKTKHITKSDN